MNKIDVNKAIIQALKKEFEYREEDYDQWLMGASIRQDESVQEFRVKVIVHTSESIYTDGMELVVTVENEVAKLEELFFEKTPDLLQETLLKKVEIEGVKLSLGEYELKVIVDGKSYYLNCRSSDTREMVMEEIKNEIIIPMMESIEAKDDSNNTNYENTKEMI